MRKIFQKERFGLKLINFNKYRIYLFIGIVCVVVLLVTITFNLNQNKYSLAKCDLFVCSSHSEGFSTAATEALIVGVPVCSVEVSGMREMLGENNEYGVITENNEEDLYEAIQSLVDNPKLLTQYKTKAKKRGDDFTMSKTVKTVEDFFLRMRGTD